MGPIALYIRRPAPAVDCRFTMQIMHNAAETKNTWKELLYNVPFYTYVHSNNIFKETDQHSTHLQAL
jgi:hypothetical protein